jgi:hypothetical protein
MEIFRVPTAGDVDHTFRKQKPSPDFSGEGLVT